MAASVEDPTRFILPKPKEALVGSGFFSFSKATPIYLGEGTTSDDQFTRQFLNDELLSRGGGSSSGRIELNRVEKWTGRDLGADGYTLTVSPTQIVLTAISARGLFYAAESLSQLASSSTIPSVQITDWPDVKNRMVLYDLRFNTLNVDYAKRWIRELARFKINQLMIFMSGDYVYDKYPFTGSPDKLTPQKLAELKKYARQYHVELIPQLESLGHAEGILQHEEFAEARSGVGNTYSYSPCTEYSYSLLNDFYSELTREFDQSDIFHVGGDEIWGFDNDPRCHSAIERHGQEHLYGSHMNRLSQMLKGYGRKMAIWGDMILERPGAHAGVPRDTIIYDWHYQEFTNFPSLKYFKSLGFNNIVAAPAVFGHWDLFPQFPTSVQNIAGFTRAALAEAIDTICVTIWEMHHGGNAENYLFGAGFAGQLLWTPTNEDMTDFHRRIASVWFGSREEDAGEHVDRAFWFPWRATPSKDPAFKDVQGYWQTLHRPGDILFQHFHDLAKWHDNDKLVTMRDESQKLIANVNAGVESRRWLEKQSHSNHISLRALETAQFFYGHVARKVSLLSKFALVYRDAHSRGDRAAMVAELAKGRSALTDLAQEFPIIEQHLKLAISERASDPREVIWWKDTRDSMTKYLELLKDAERDLQSELPAPAPAELGL